MTEHMSTTEPHSILIVDDDPDVCQVLKDLLASAGYRIQTASDGREGLDHLMRESYDLVLLDVWMPRMNGIEFLGELHARWLLPKVIVMTGDNAPETALKAVKEQAHHYIIKPYEPKALLHLVADVLASPTSTPPVEIISAKPDWVELLVPCEMASAGHIQSFLDRLEANLTPEVRRAVGDAFRELLLNAIEWGGKLDPNSKVRIAYLRMKKMLLYRIADPGVGFRLEELNHTAVNNPAEDPLQHVMVREEKGMRPGGFGILMARSMVDEILYNEARNEVVMVKYLD